MPYTEKALAAGRHMADVVVPHAAFREALDLIANALDMGNAVGLFAGVRVTAPSGSGKSLLIDCLQRNTINSPYLAEPLSVIRTELKEAPSVSQIQGGLLDNFGYCLTGRGRMTINNNEVHKVLIDSMRVHKVQLVVLDEFQHVFSPTSEKVSTFVTDEEHQEAYENALDLAQQLVGYARRKERENPAWTREFNLTRIRDGIQEKVRSGVWDFTAEEQEWVMGRLTKLLEQPEAGAPAA